MDNQPDDFIIRVIEQAFILRQRDAFQRCHRQIELWQNYSRLGGLTDVQRAAAAERIKKLRTIFLSYMNRYTPRDEEGPTPEAVVQRAYRGPDNVVALLENNKLTTDHERAVREIQNIVEAVTASQHARGPKFERGGTGGGNQDFLKNYIAHWWSWRYVPWSEQITTHYPAATVKMIRAFIIDGLSLSAARCIGRMSYGRALEILKRALDHYNKIKEDDENYDPEKGRGQVLGSSSAQNQPYHSAT